jgi:CheY-like chemotaxis protein
MQTAYDVILMDVQMPELDGLEASRTICAGWPAGQRPRIVGMTAEALQGDREKCLPVAMDDYIVKPVTLEQLGVAHMLKRTSAMLAGRCSPGNARSSSASREPASSATRWPA